jgi:hypothetical protein
MEWDTRFQKVCGMLGSAHEGEPAAAAVKATEMLHAQGLTWADVTASAARPRELPPSTSYRVMIMHMVGQCDADGRKGTPAEIDAAIDALVHLGNLAPARGEWLKSYHGGVTDEEGTTSDMINIFGIVVYARRHGAYPDRLTA